MTNVLAFMRSLIVIAMWVVLGIFSILALLAFCLTIGMLIRHFIQHFVWIVEGWLS